MEKTTSRHPRIFEGTISYWDDKMGYGFICTTTPKAQRVFFHISAYQGQLRPKEGEAVFFTTVKKDERVEAREVKPKFELQPDDDIKIPRAYKPPKEKGKLLGYLKSALTWVKFFASVAAVSVWFYLLWDNKLLALFYFYGSLSAILLLLYASDKRAAVNRSWRTSELTLHFFAIIGGWPGGLIGRYLFNHKTTKTNFFTVFWITVIINLALTFYVVYIDTSMLFQLEYWRQKIISIYINIRY